MLSSFADEHGIALVNSKVRLTKYAKELYWIEQRGKLSPYLLNVKKLSNKEAYSMMNDWLDKCNKVERLNFNAKAKIREGLNGASKAYYPISLEKLKSRDYVKRL